MRLECPNCHVKIDLVGSTTENETSCPECGSRVPFRVPSETKTTTYRQGHGGRIGPFELFERVGVGQFGAVWRAFDTRLQRIVALKVPRREEFDDRTRAMFLREARSAATLEHLGIVRIHEVSEGDGDVYIVSEFIHGGTLKDRLLSERYSHITSAEMIAAVAEAVEYAHGKGIIHRDLKPGNILVDPEGKPHVTDFGLAKHLGGDFTMTAAGEILGTPAYMSPEQARGDSRLVDRRSDVFSLGIILYEMLTGSRPFEGTSQIQLLQQIQSRDPRGLRTIDRLIPRDLETICLKAIAKNPDSRYATAGELAADLRRFLDGASILARPEGLSAKGIRWVRRNRSLTVAGGLAFTSMFAALGMAFRDRVPESPAIPKGAVVEIVAPMHVRIETEPSGAEVVIVPRDAYTGEAVDEKIVRPEQRAPVTVDLLPGEYFILAKLDDGRFHEVQRYVPTEVMEFVDYFRHRSWTPLPGTKDYERSISLAKIVIPSADITEGMVEFSGSPLFVVGVDGNKNAVPVHSRRVDSFLLDTHEVTIGQYLAANQGLYPRNLKPQGDPLPDDFPLTHLLVDSAIEHAEKIGKRLPTEFEFEFAATNGAASRFPWGNDLREIGAALMSVGKPDFDQTQTTPPVFGLFSNGAEFTQSWHAPYPMFSEAAKSMMPSPGTNVSIRGGLIGNELDATTGLNVAEVGARMRLSLARANSVNDRIGFRCARSKSPRW